MPNDFDYSHFRRRYERKPYGAEIYFSADKIAYRAHLVNLSRGGALIRHGGVAQVALGDQIIITIPFTDSKRSVKRDARIVWVEEAEFGIEFI